MSASYLRKYGAAFVKWEVAMKKHLRVVMEFTEENNMGMNNGRKNGERAFLDLICSTIDESNFFSLFFKKTPQRITGG